MNKDTTPKIIDIADGQKILLGYPYRSESNLEDQTFSPEDRTRYINIGNIVNERYPDCLVYVTWNVIAQRFGIYRFEIEPGDLVPFLLVRGSESPKRVEYQILINGIPLLGDKTIRFDPLSDKFLPRQFLVPLQEGKNQLSWIMNCNNYTRILPKIFGLKSSE